MTFTQTALKLLYGQQGGGSRPSTLSGFLYGVDSDDGGGGGVDTDAVNRLIEQALADTTGFRQTAIAVANATVNNIADTPIPIHLETNIRTGYSTNGNLLAAPINQDLHLGYQIEVNRRGGDQLFTRFLPSRLYSRGNANPAPISEGGSTFNVVYTYAHNATSGHDEIGLSVDLLTGRGGTPDPLIDIEIWEVNVSVVSETGGQTAEQVRDAIVTALAPVNTRIDEAESDIELNEQTIGNNQDNIRNLDTFSRTRASTDSVNALNGRVTSVATDLAGKADTSDLAGKQDIRPYDIDIDNHYYVRHNIKPVEYALEFKNIVSSLLPRVNRISISIKGSPVHSGAFDTSIAHQVIAVELSGTELQNTNRNIRADENQIIFEVSLLQDTTVVVTERLPIAIVDAPPKIPSRDILTWDQSRAATVNATLPTNYTDWNICKVVIAQGGNSDTVLVFTEDLARGNLSNYGRGNNKFSWDSTSRVIDPQGGQRAANLVVVSLI